jgi:hypothetical protein
MIISDAYAEAGAGLHLVAEDRRRPYLQPGTVIHDGSTMLLLDGRSGQGGVTATARLLKAYDDRPQVKFSPNQCPATECQDDRA